MGHATKTLVLMAAGQMALWSVAIAQPAYPVTEKMKQLLKTNESFGLKKFPVSIWNYTNLKEHGDRLTEAEMQSLADAGVTVPQGPIFDPGDPAQKAHMLKMLDWAAKRDMKLILQDPRGAGQHEKDGKPPAGYAAGFKKAVADFGTHPGTFGFFIGDEPGGQGMEAFAECQRIQKQIAPGLHSFLNHLPVMAADWDKYLDKYLRLSGAEILGYDCYSQLHMRDGQRGIDSYFDNLRVYREASLRNGVPFWNTALSIGHCMYRCPTLDEFRWQFNTSVAAGANGMVWFFWYQPAPTVNYRLGPVDEFWEKTQTYHDIRRVQQSFHKTYGGLFNRLVSTRVSFYPRAAANNQTWTPNELVTGIWPAYDQSLPILVGEFTDIEGRRYVMFVNNSQTKTDRVLMKFPKNAKLYSCAYGSGGKEHEGAAGCSDSTPSVDGNNLVVWHWLAPGQEAVYRVEIGK